MSTTTRTRFHANLTSSSNFPPSSAEQVERLRRVAETCPVRKALETGFAFNERLVVGPAASEAAEVAR
jgi:hypothetical protein